MASADLLLELFSEEIPARMQAAAMDNLFSALHIKMSNAGIKYNACKTFVTPRRLALIVYGLPTTQPVAETELKGPKVGAPEAALQGFLKKNNLAQNDLTERDGAYFATVKKGGGNTAELLKPIIEDILKTFPWPKSMRWGAGDSTWVRPLHSILCIFDGKVVPVEFAGVKAGNTTFGHRFLAPEPIAIGSADEYETKLEKAFVIATRVKRLEKIAAEAEKAATKLGLRLRKDDALLEEVTGLAEWPVIRVGTIDAKYMDLPPEVLVSEMRGHQKYFALEKPDGTLADKFLITANTDKGEKNVVSGNERVLRARLADGRFFWDQDRKKKLEDWAEGLKTVTFHARLGSIADKAERVKTLAKTIAETIYNLQFTIDNVERTADLCKADLTTGMVGEFPELQGVMGRYYALHQEEKPEVADAIRDHYKPLGPSDAVPAQPIAVCVALADKLDTLTSLFAIGEKPTGSKDPFALRRAALGVIRIILENKLRLPLKTCFAAPAKTIALNMAQAKLEKKTEARLHEPPEAHRVGKYLAVSEIACEDLEDAVPPGLADTLHAFFIDRLKVQLKDSGMRHDIISAVVANGDDDLLRIVARAAALQNFLATDDGANLLAAYKRAANILGIEEKKDKKQYSGLVDVQLLKTAEERALFDALEKLAVEVRPLLADEHFVGAMEAMSRLRQPVDVFFEKVLVNDTDAATRANRLSLLSQLRSTLDSIADFALIEG